MKPAIFLQRKMTVLAAAPCCWSGDVLNIVACCGHQYRALVTVRVCVCFLVKRLDQVCFADCHHPEKKK